jgi:hypothetical protein
MPCNPGRPGCVSWFVIPWTRLAAAFAVVAVCVVLPFARTPAGPAHHAPARGEPVPMTGSFSSMGLSFRYPATWQRQTWSDDESSFSTLLVALSTGQQHDPCTATTSKGHKSITCTSPIAKLAPGGILVSWDAAGFPTTHLPTPDTTIGGSPAYEKTTTGDTWCTTTLSGTETITVIIPTAVPDNWYEMDACLRAPHLSQQKAQISAMLRTVQLPSGD